MRVLLVGENPARNALVEQGLRNTEYVIIARVPTAELLLDEVCKSKADIAVIETDLPDDSVLEQVRQLSHRHHCPIVMFTVHGDAEACRAAVKAGVSAYVVDGLQSERVRFILDVAVTRFHESQALQKQLEKATGALAGRKLVERAKGIVMRRNKVTEDVAYHTLRKMAMNRNKHIVDVAESVITAEEVLPQHR